MTANQIAYWKMLVDKEHNERMDAETSRSNLEREHENLRHNTATEALNSAQVFGNLRLGESQLSVAQGQLAESIRHSMAVEDETQRSNLASEAEKKRHNEIQEQVSFSGNLLDWAKYGSTAGTVNPVGGLAGVGAGAVFMPGASEDVLKEYLDRYANIFSHVGSTYGRISSSLGSILGSGDSSMYRKGTKASANPRDPKNRATK